MTLYEWETRVWALFMHLLERRPVPSLFAEYREGTPYQPPTDQWGRDMVQVGRNRWITRDQFEENGT